MEYHGDIMRIYWDRLVIIGTGKDCLMAMRRKVTGDLVLIYIIGYIMTI